MRLYIVRALVDKEFRRHLANRGGIALALLLVAAAVLLSVFNPGGTDESGVAMVGGVHHCYIEYSEETSFVKTLQKTVPLNLQSRILFRPRFAQNVDGLVTYEPGCGAIQIRSFTDKETGRAGMKFWVWHPAGDPTAMAPYEAWFWKAARLALQSDAEAKLGAPLPAFTTDTDDLWAVRASFKQLEEQAEAARKAKDGSAPAGSAVPVIAIERDALAAKPLDFRSAIATGMVVFALYFACVYLLPTLNCEERERGVLLAQALSPASPIEILFAKFLFYPVAGIGLAAIIAGVYRPAVLTTPFFWLATLAVSAGFLGIGMTVAALARTQRAAFLGSMCYLMTVSLFLFICSTNGIPFLPYAAVEFHGPRILHAAVEGSVEPRHWKHLLGAFGLAAVWLTSAGWLFRRRGWQ